MRAPHALGVKIPHKEGKIARISREIPEKNVMAPALLKMDQIRVDSEDGFPRVRGLFATKQR